MSCMVRVAPNSDYPPREAVRKRALTPTVRRPYALAPLKTIYTAALALVACCLLPSSPLHAAGAIVVPGTADLVPWKLLRPPAGEDTNLPYAKWTEVNTFPTEEECRKAAGSVWREYERKQQENRRSDSLLMMEIHEEETKFCLATDDPRLKGEDDPRIKEK
jgi:hypothetical protein